MKKNQSKEVSSDAVTQEEVESCVTDLGRLTVTVSRGSKPLSKQERARLPRSRKDGASIAREVAQLAQKYGADGAVNSTRMLSFVTEAERLAPLDKVARNFSVLVHDRAFAADAAAWKSATAGYTMLKRMAIDNPDLARDLLGITATLKRSKSAAPATSGSSGTAKATTTAATPVSTPAPQASQVAPQAPLAK